MRTHMRSQLDWSELDIVLAEPDALLVLDMFYPD